MPRNPRVVLPGLPFHITQRGIRKSNIFLEDSDFILYSKLLLKASRDNGLHIHSYTWMSNHVHIIAVPDRVDTLSKVFRKVHSSYARIFNAKYELRGYLWQDRFYSCPLDETHFWAAIRYVERNPVRAGMVQRAENYRWSSARAHCGLVYDPLLEGNLILPLDGTKWSDWLNESNQMSCDQKIRDCTSGGWPCGDEDFVQRLERISGRVLSPQKGRGDRGRRPN